MCEVVLAMSWIPISFRITRSFPSGTCVPSWDNLWVFQGSILQPWPLCATHTQGALAHSSTLSLMTSLRLFFSGGKSEEDMDKICQKLFDSERENYVEEECDSDGVPIYELPPLDEPLITTFWICSR